jgi:signal recognition particle receptor subunit alpha
MRHLYSYQAVYQSLLHLSWIDELLDNTATIFVNLYKEQLRSARCRVVEYPFDKYFDQQIRELEDATGAAYEETVDAFINEKKDSPVLSDNGGPPPPPVPSLLKGTNSAKPLLLFAAKNLR